MNTTEITSTNSKNKGFTLIEVLIAIVVVGILAAVVIIGIGALTDKGSQSACEASRDSVKAGLTVHYANNNGTYPATMQAMQTAGEIEIPSGATLVGNLLTGNGWTITMTPGSPPTLSVC